MNPRTIKKIRKWFTTYKVWTWTAIALLTITLGTLGYIIVSFGAASFVFPLILLSSALLVYKKIKGEAPPVWMTVVAISIPLFLWGFWVLKPDWYEEWRHSNQFLWMVVTAVALAWLSGNRRVAVANTARTGLLVLMLAAVVMGAYGKWKEDSVANASVTSRFSPAPPPPAPLNYTVLLKATNEWTMESTYVLPEDTIGADISLTLLDPKGEKNCYKVLFSQGEFPACPGQPFEKIEGHTSFVRVKMNEPQETPREFALLIKRP